MGEANKHCLSWLFNLNPLEKFGNINMACIKLSKGTLGTNFDI